MKKYTIISKDALVKDVQNMLIENNISFEIERSMSSSVYFITNKGNIRISNHNENPNKLTLTKAYLYFNSLVRSEHEFVKKSDKKSYEDSLKYALKAVI